MFVCVVCYRLVFLPSLGLIAWMSGLFMCSWMFMVLLDYIFGFIGYACYVFVFCFILFQCSRLLEGKPIVCIGSLCCFCFLC